MLSAAKGSVYQAGADELVVARARKLTKHLDLGLYRILAVLRDDLLVYLLVGALYVTGVDVFCYPEVALAIETLKEIALVAPGVAKRAPEPVWCVFCKKPLRHVPDRVWNT